MRQILEGTKYMCFLTLIKQGIKIIVRYLEGKMKKLVMRKKASENVYFHPDFHIAMNLSLKYVEENFGPDGVKEFLRQFANAYYKPLKEKIKKQGLLPLKKHIEQIYKKEGGKIEISFNKDMLKVFVKKCPAISHIKKNCVPVAKTFSETTKTVYSTLVEGTGYQFELAEYDNKTGKAILIFTKAHQ